jgi:hypothetical protein
VFRRSSAVEQLTVNQLVVGSIPTAGAKYPNNYSYLVTLFIGTLYKCALWCRFVCGSILTRNVM